MPVLETPQGELFGESGHLVQFALEAGAGKGLDLIPKDPILALRMRKAMEEFDRLKVSIFPVFGTRGQDNDKIDAFAATLHKHNDFAAFVDQGKWLMGTSEPTLLDVWCAPFWEILCSWHEGAM